MKCKYLLLLSLTFIYYVVDETIQPISSQGPLRCEEARIIKNSCSNSSTEKGQTRVAIPTAIYKKPAQFLTKQ